MLVLILLYLDLSGQSDAFGLVGRRSLASPYEEFIRMVGSDGLKISVELVEVLEIPEIVAHAYRWIYAFDLAGSEGTTEIRILDL